jgi:hypothetical protein
MMGTDEVTAPSYSELEVVLGEDFCADELKSILNGFLAENSFQSDQLREKRASVPRSTYDMRSGKLTEEYDFFDVLEFPLGKGRSILIRSRVFYSNEDERTKPTLGSVNRFFIRKASYVDPENVKNLVERLRAYFLDHGHLRPY